MSPTPAMLGVDQLGIVGKVAGIYRRAEAVLANDLFQCSRATDPLQPAGHLAGSMGLSEGSEVVGGDGL